MNQASAAFNEIYFDSPRVGILRGSTFGTLCCIKHRKFEFDLFFTFFADFYFGGRDTISFVTLNKVSGFLQRMDLARKYEFGKMLVIGSESPDKVKGLWLFRGKEIPPSVLDECYDMELYERLKVDTSDELRRSVSMR